MTWQGPLVPVVHANYWSEDIQKATLLRPLHLNAERKGRTTQSLIEEHLPEVELVEVQVTLNQSSANFERGDLISWMNVNEPIREYGTVLKLVDDPTDEKLKVFFVDDYRSDGFLYEEDITLMCKANNRLDDWQSVVLDIEKEEQKENATPENLPWKGMS